MAYLLSHIRDHKLGVLLGLLVILGAVVIDLVFSAIRLYQTAFFRWA